MSTDRLQAKKVYDVDDPGPASTPVGWTTDLLDGQGKNPKTFTILAENGDGQADIQFSFDRLEWFSHPSSSNPVNFTGGTPATITVFDVMPFYKVVMTITGGSAGRLRCWYTA